MGVKGRASTTSDDFKRESLALRGMKRETVDVAFDLHPAVHATGRFDGLRAIECVVR